MSAQHVMTRRFGTVAAAFAALLALAACGSGFAGGGTTTSPGAGGTATGGGGGGGGSLTILIGSSGDAETDAVNSAVAAWSEQSGTQAEVRVASDLVQELS